MIGRIYKIITSNSNECYVGSTFNELRFRWAKHKSDYGKWLKGRKPTKLSSYELFEKYGIKNCKIILIKEYEVVDKRHLEIYEQIWINKLRPINKLSAFSIKWLYDKQQYRMKLEKNPNFCKDQYQKALQENPNHSKDNYQKALQKNPNHNKDKYQKALQENPNYSKDNYQKALQENPNHNKDKYQKALQKNPNLNKQKIVCECGMEVNKKHYAQHKRTKKHTEKMDL